MRTFSPLSYLQPARHRRLPSHARETAVSAADPELLHAICAGLLRRFQGTHMDWLECTRLLSPYPTDLLCAAYHHVYHKEDTPFPELTLQMLRFMEPEFRYRLQRYTNTQRQQEETA